MMIGYAEIGTRHDLARPGGACLAAPVVSGDYPTESSMPQC
jgi:hypothetical protein